MNKKLILCLISCLFIGVLSFGQTNKGKAVPLFAPDLSNAEYDPSVWKLEKGGVISASADKEIWTTKQYENFELTLEFKNDVCTNSGVIIYCIDKQNWIPHSVEIQIADDYCDKWTGWRPDFTCGAVFGHLAPSQPGLVKKPGEWNKMKIIAKGKQLLVELNGKRIIDMDMNRWTSGKINPDGTEIPSWLPHPKSEQATKGYIGFQGKHGAASIWFRNVKIKEL